MEERDLLLMEIDEDPTFDNLEVYQIVQQMEPAKKQQRGGHFKLENYTEDQCLSFFRFGRVEIRHLCMLMKFPEVMRTSSGVKASGVEVLCIVLRRLAYPCRYEDLAVFFCRAPSTLCNIFYHGLDHIFSRYSSHLTNFNQPWLSVDNLMLFANTIAAKGAPLDNCWGFVDGTVRHICRPTRLQKEVYNGHKRYHGIKFQSVATPNGLICNLYGPLSGRRHDAALLNASGLLEFAAAHCNKPDGEPLVLYGDPAYPQTRHLLRPVRGQHLTAAQEDFNKGMSQVRQSVEWCFGKVITLWAFLDFNKNMKLFKTPVGKLYIVGVILTNCHTCIYGSETSQYFRLNPPRIEEYLY